jgi:hypothetical protein
LFPYQVVSSLPSTLHQPFGLYASLLLRVFSHATMPSLQALPWACFPNSMLFSHTQGTCRFISSLQICVM